MEQLIGMWAIIGMILFLNGNTQTLFKTKWVSIFAHGPLVWFAYIGPRIKRFEKDE